MNIRSFITSLLVAGVVVMFSGCASLPLPEVMKEETLTYQVPVLPESGKAIVYVVRPSSLWGLTRFNVFLDNEDAQSEMGYNRARQYIYFTVSPGKHKIYSKAENVAELELSASAGDVIFIQQEVAMGLVMARNSISRLEDYEGKYHVKKLTIGTVLKTGIRNGEQLSGLEQQVAQQNEAQRKREEAERQWKIADAVRIIKDCAECPEMVEIPAGSFQMGANDAPFASPIHTVTLSRSFALGRTEITQGQWKAIMSSNPSYFKACGGNCPVDSVTWDEAKDFIQRLNAKTGKGYRLPSEAEWEYACRAGKKYEEYCGGDQLDAVGWYGEAGPHPVGEKHPNAWGLYDMSGNVWEWVEDCWHRSYNGAPSDGSAWISDCGSFRISRGIRGGTWYFSADNARAATRSYLAPTNRHYIYGFRVARDIP